MYKILYKENGKTEDVCLGNYTDIEIAVNAMDKLESGVLGSTGSFRIVREGHEKQEEQEEIWKTSVMRHFTKVE